MRVIAERGGTSDGTDAVQEGPVGSRGAIVSEREARSTDGRPIPPIGIVTTRLENPAISERPLAMARCTAGSAKRAFVTGLILPDLVIHSASGSAGSCATT